MFIDKNSREELSKDKLSEALDLFKKARLMDKKKCVQDIIRIIDEKKAYTFTEPKKDGNFIAFGYYDYNEKLYDIMEIIQPDYDYLENFKKIKDKDIASLSMKELETYITRIIRGEKFVEGLIASCIDDGTFKRLLERFLELYEKNEFEEMKKETKKLFYKPTQEDINKIINKIISLRKNKKFTIGEYIKKFDLSEEEKNTYAKQIYDGILGYVDFISGGSYTFDTLPCERNERKLEKATLRKTMLDKAGNEYEIEENLENIDFPDDINSLKKALNKPQNNKVPSLDYLKLLEDIEIKYNMCGYTATLDNILKNQNKTYENARLLSLEEIFNAPEELSVDFVSYGLLPVFDAFDNDFICYQTKDGKWCMFNIVDEISYKKDSTLIDLLDFKS